MRKARMLVIPIAVLVCLPGLARVSAAVPTPTGNDAVITVKVGNARTSPTTVSGLPGFSLRLYDGTTSPTTPVPDAWATCMSDAAGDCSFVVPETQLGGANRDRQFWVKATGAPAGSLTIPTLVTGSVGALQSTAYEFRTGAQLQAGSTYPSSGIWPTALINPTAPAGCGMKVALVLDLSGSVGPDLNNLKTAAKTFTNSLSGTPSQVALFTFATNGPANQSNNQNRPLTSVSTQAGADTINAWIGSGNNGAGVTGLTSGGEANWDRGLHQVAQSSADFDVAMIITSGNPTAYGTPASGGGGVTGFRELENAVFSANAVKAEDTRVVVFGVGPGIGGDPANLRAISGPSANSDFHRPADYPTAGALLRGLALGSCAGSVSVIKQEVPSTAPAGTIDGATPAGGWQVGAQTSTSGVTINPASGTTAAATGAINFELTFPGGTSTATVGITETQQSGYTLIQRSGANAVCRRLDDQTSLAVTNAGANSFTVAGAVTHPVSCLIYNRAPPKPASLIVEKKWIVDGTAYDDGQQPTDLVAALAIDSSPQAWSTPRSGLLWGQIATINETTDLDAEDCRLTSSALTEFNGITQTASIPYTAALVPGTNTATITNMVTCVPRVPPSAPRAVSVVPGDRRVSVAWAAPAFSGSAAITGYTVTATPGGKRCTTTGRSCVVTGLTNQQSYRFGVVARSADGVSPAATSGRAIPQPAATVKVKAKKAKSLLFVDVNPNQGSSSWAVQVQRQRGDGSWKSLKRYATEGAKERLKIDLKKGTYRVLVRPKFGYRGVTSGPVRLKR